MVPEVSKEVGEVPESLEIKGIGSKYEAVNKIVVQNLRTN